MYINKTNDGVIIITATPSHQFSNIGDEYVYENTITMLNWTSYNDVTTSELKTRYLDRYYRIYQGAYSEWIQIEDLGELSDFPAIDPNSPMSFELKWVRGGTNTSGAISLSEFQIEGTWDVPSASQPLSSFGSIGAYFILKPLDTYKAFNITGFTSTIGGESPNKYLQIKYRISQNSGRAWTQWEILTNENISTLRINPIRFFTIEYEVKRVGSDNTGTITLYDLQLTGEFQNVTADYQTTNAMGIRSCCNASNTNFTDGNPQNCPLPGNFSPMTDSQKSQLFNPYAVNKAVQLWNSLTNSTMQVFGHDTLYIITSPDGNGIDYTLHEHQLYNYECSGSIKAIPQDNNFPDNQLKMNQFDLALFDTFEVQVTKDDFKSVFGVDRRPAKEDLIYFCELNKIFKVEHAQALKNFNNASVYYKIVLGKYNQQANKIPANKDIRDQINKLTKNSTLDELIGIEMKNDKTNVANKPQFKTLSKDLIRHNIYARINKELIENASIVLSKSNYDLVSVAYGATAVTYTAIDPIIQVSDNRAYTAWFNINNYTMNEVFNFVDNTSGSNGYKITLSGGTFSVNWNGNVYSMPVSINENVWYSYLVNIDQRQRKIYQYLYKRNVANEVDAGKMNSTILMLLKDTQDDIAPQNFELENNELCIKGSDMKLTNIRVFNDVIPFEQHHKMMNQTIIRDTQYLVFADNANQRITLNNYPFNGNQ